MYNLCTETSRRGIEKVPCQKQKEKQGSYKDGRVYSAGVTFSVREEFAFCNVLYCHLIAGGINSFSGNIRKKRRSPSSASPGALRFDEHTD